MRSPIVVAQKERVAEHVARRLLAIDDVRVRVGGGRHVAEAPSAKRCGTARALEGIALSEIRLQRKRRAAPIQSDGSRPWRRHTEPCGGAAPGAL